MSVRTRRMFAIPFAINLSPVAVILRQCGILSCNQRAHDPPMFAIPPADVCRSLQLEFLFLLDTGFGGFCDIDGSCCHQAQNGCELGYFLFWLSGLDVHPLDHAPGPPQ
jgi:hypothetical protein